MDRKTSVRNFVPSPDKGVDGRTFVGGSLASKTPAQSAKNETKQSTVANPPTAAGGKNTNS
jgi:hypothetical protein